MPSLADTLLAAADASHAEFFGVEVDFVRGSSTISAVTARVGIQEYEVVERGGTITIAKVREYVIVKADLTIDATAIEPRRGDHISETLGGVERSFEVLPQADRPAFEEDDTDGRLWRIRTKEVAT